MHILLVYYPGAPRGGGLHGDVKFIVYKTCFSLPWRNSDQSRPIENTTKLKIKFFLIIKRVL